MENKLDPREEAFIEYWEKNRLREKKLLNQLLIGLPLGILFGAPVLLNLFMGWYRRADMEANTRLNPIVLIVALLLIIVFIAIFSRKHKWEMKEQQYLEFLAKKQRLEKAGPPAANQEV
jgi:integral membrane sensor domain MASE1